MSPVVSSDFGDVDGGQMGSRFLWIGAGWGLLLARWGLDPATFRGDFLGFCHLEGWCRKQWDVDENGGQ